MSVSGKPRAHDVKSGLADVVVASAYGDIGSINWLAGQTIVGAASRENAFFLRDAVLQNKNSCGCAVECAWRLEKRCFLLHYLEVYRLCEGPTCVVRVEKFV